MGTPRRKRMKAFQYIIIHHPSEAAKKLKTVKDEILVPLTTVLAADQQSALLLAARVIPDHYLDSLDEIEVAIRPF